MRVFRGRLSPRDQKIAVNKALDHWAAMSGKPTPDAIRNEIPPKRIRVRRPVDGKAPVASEHQEQSAVISWWARVHTKYALPEFSLFACPSGGARDVITGSLLKAEGVRRGVPDLILAKPVGPYSGLFLEMKVGYNKLTDSQFAFIAYLESVGYKASVHWSAGSAITEIEDYLRDEIAP
jgi:hypothetical protein